MRWRHAVGAGALVFGLLGVGGTGRAGADASVAVALGSAANEFSLVLFPAEVRAGDVVLEATNGGDEEHTLALKGGTPTAEIAPGGSETLSVGTLSAGTYTFVCTISGHEQLGMKADLTVAGEAETTTTTVATTTTTAAGATTTTAAAGATSTTAAAGATTTTIAGRTATTTTVATPATATGMTAPPSRLSETGPGDLWREAVGGLVVLNIGYLLWSATHPSRRRGGLTG